MKSVCILLLGLLGLSAMMCEPAGPTPQDDVAFCDSVQAHYDFFLGGENLLCCSVEQLPELVGGAEVLLAHVDYPEAAQAAGIEGCVVAKFVVDTTGQTRCLSVRDSLGYGLDEAVLYAVGKVRYTPRKTRITPVNAFMYLPVRFMLPDTISLGCIK